MKGTAFTQHVHVLGVDLLVGEEQPLASWLWRRGACCRRGCCPAAWFHPVERRRLVGWARWRRVYGVIEKVLVDHVSQFLRQLQEWKWVLLPLLHLAVLKGTEEDE